jgi:hypothetical protein
MGEPNQTSSNFYSERNEFPDATSTTSKKTSRSLSSSASKRLIKRMKFDERVKVDENALATTKSATTTRTLRLLHGQSGHFLRLLLWQHLLQDADSQRKSQRCLHPLHSLGQSGHSRPVSNKHLSALSKMLEKSFARFSNRSQEICGKTDTTL